MVELDFIHFDAAGTFAAGTFGSVNYLFATAKRVLATDSMTDIDSPDWKETVMPLFEDALWYYNVAVKYPPNDVAAVHYGIGLIYSRFRNHEDAISHFSTSLEIDRKVDQKSERFRSTLKLIAHDACSVEDYALGSSSFREALFFDKKEDPRSLMVALDLFNIAMCEGREGKFKDCISMYLQV